MSFILQWLYINREWSIPIIGGLIGWFTNHVAVKMLFWPRRPVILFGYKIQGLVPRHHADLAESIGQTVEEHLISSSTIQELLLQPESQEMLNSALRKEVRELIEVKLFNRIPLFKPIFNSRMRYKLEDTLFDELKKWLPDFTAKTVKRLDDLLDFRKLVEEKVLEFDLDRLEHIIRQIAWRELKAIEIWGGILGFLIGFVQLIIMKL